ncbi:thiamine-phosphate kinase [Sphingomonas oligophenolica]|uniref:Thiamine-monophosphate kinase n=1 Tax=Sphingomonas oligophenolica TaxID=301154 RepID=A0A502CFJ6_9SPHN|nr:thiamine-phosphate kinase [Sphingomonas oligophenolica]TPG10799.1 thiamine-phosphate kinase [Sphingomonas oligophenolica]
MTEADFIAALRTLPLHPAARALADDVALLGGMIVTTDTLVEGIHFLPDDPAADVAWKLVATNLSDLAAKGSTPIGVLLNYPLSDAAWDRGFLKGLGDVLAAHDCPLIGGDTVSLPAGAPRVLTVTAFGQLSPAPPRSGALAGDRLWVTGTIGDAGAGLAIARGEAGPATLLARYRRPTPRLAEGRRIARSAHAMMDVSDGLLIDAQRMAAASGVAVTIDLARVPLSADYLAWSGDPIAAATAGDDYELLFAAAPAFVPTMRATMIGRFSDGAGLTLTNDGAPTPLPARLGFDHGTAAP